MSRTLLLSALVGLAVIPSAAQANERVTPTVVDNHSSIEQPASLSTLFNQAFFDNTGNFYEAITIGSQLNTILGFKSFPETQIVQDAELLNTRFREALAQQVTSKPLLRTPDLNNPFDTSLLSNPAYYRASDLAPSPAGEPSAP